MPFGIGTFLNFLRRKTASDSAVLERVKSGERRLDSCFGFSDIVIPKGLSMENFALDVRMEPGYNINEQRNTLNALKRALRARHPLLLREFGEKKSLVILIEDEIKKYEKCLSGSKIHGTKSTEEYYGQQVGYYTDLLEKYKAGTIS